MLYAQLNILEVWRDRVRPRVVAYAYLNFQSKQLPQHIPRKLVLRVINVFSARLNLR